MYTHTLCTVHACTCIHTCVYTNTITSLQMVLCVYSRVGINEARKQTSEKGLPESKLEGYENIAQDKYFTMADLKAEKFCEAYTTVKDIYITMHSSLC